MRRLVGLSLLTILVASASWSFAFEDSYDCHELAETSIGWDWKDHKYSTTASTALKSPAIVKLSDLNTSRPFLTGQQVTPIRKISETSGVAWFIEEAELPIAQDLALKRVLRDSEMILKSESRTLKWWSASRCVPLR